MLEVGRRKRRSEVVTGRCGIVRLSFVILLSPSRRDAKVRSG